MRLVGHSMGGKVAMALALTRPELVERLIVVDIAPIRYAQGYEHFIRAMQALDLALAAPARRCRRRPWPRPCRTRRCAASCCRTWSTVDGRLAWQPNLAVLLRAMPEIIGLPRRT